MVKPVYDQLPASVQYLLHMADNALIMGHRNSEWCGHGPVLEQDIAIANIALDMIGQARMFYQYAAELMNGQANADGSVVTEDTLAYLRDVTDFKNTLLAEQPNGDWAVTTLRQFFISVYQRLLYQHLMQSADRQLAAIAAKSLKEVLYHVKWSSEWVIRLGDGTQESNARMQRALAELWPYTGELFYPAPYEQVLIEEGRLPDPVSLKTDWLHQVAIVFGEATLLLPSQESWHQNGGKNGVHSEHLGFVLAEMQFLQRAYPGNEW